MPLVTVTISLSPGRVQPRHRRPQEDQETPEDGSEEEEDGIFQKGSQGQEAQDEGEVGEGPGHFTVTLPLPSSATWCL